VFTTAAWIYGGTTEDIFVWEVGITIF